MDVLQYALPEGVECVNQSYNDFGRDRSIYDYHILLRGDAQKLLAYTQLLGLKEEGEDVRRPVASTEVFGRKEKSENSLANTHDNFMKSDGLKWWNPPSLSNKTEYRAFQRKYGTPSSKDKQYCRTRAELIGDKLYLAQVGDIILNPRANQ